MNQITFQTTKSPNTDQNKAERTAENTSRFTRRPFVTPTNSSVMSAPPFLYDEGQTHTKTLKTLSRTTRDRQNHGKIPKDDQTDKHTDLSATFAFNKPASISEMISSYPILRLRFDNDGFGNAQVL